MLALAACTAAPEDQLANQLIEKHSLAAVLKKSPEQLAAEVRSRENTKEKETIYWGSDIIIKSSYRLVSWRYEDTPVIRHHLFATLAYGAATEPESEDATDYDGEPMEVVERKRVVNSCNGKMCEYSVFLSVNIEHHYLLDHKDQGFGIKLRSRAGKFIMIQQLTVPPNYVKGQLIAIGAL